MLKRLFECLILCLLAVLLMVYSGSLIFGVLNAVYGDVANVPPGVLGNLILVSPAFPFVLGVVAVIRLKIAGTDLSELIGFSRSTIGGDFLLGVAIGVAGLAMALASMWVLSPVLPVPPFHLIPAPAHLYLATIGAVVPGICEELFFRGMLFRIAPPAPRWLLVTGTAIAFAFWHIATPIYLLHTFLLGLLLGTAFAVKGRLAPAMIGHTLANASFGVWILAGLPVAGN